ncbi:MAG TPA: BON domain-containing protein [Fimbriimonas sp.]|nr:BON domain-containing protein [Fimbriimonas sp.]
MKTDEQLRLDVINELGREPSLDASTIGVAVDNGVVTVTGHIPSFAQKLNAENAVQRVPGVRALAQELEVRLPSDHIRDDSDLAEAAANAIRWSTWLSNDEIKVRVENGWITLSGTATSGFNRQAAERAVRELKGVVGVLNLVSVKQKADARTIEEQINKAFEAAALRDAHRIYAEVNDGTITLRGHVRSWTEREDAEKAALSSPGVSKVVNYISLV